MKKVFPVGWDGALSPVLAADKQEAEEKLSRYLIDRGYHINHVFAYDPSDAYNEWIKEFDIEIVC